MQRRVCLHGERTDRMWTCNGSRRSAFARLYGVIFVLSVVQGQGTTCSSKRHA
ncbi:wall associated domain protein [Xanthomonas citri pv. punicae str. LMG 859]|nr:wall associated domain protein [Xanthomonas citri pv. punicae str. LMG 859]